MKQYSITVAGHTFQIKLLSDPRQPTVQVEVDGHLMEVKVESAGIRSAVASPETVLAAAGEPGTTISGPVESVSTGPRLVAAPLPGIVKSIAVKPGDEVAPNDILLVIEAMKMDNIIRASRGGTVGVVLTAEGRQVDHGAPLIEFAD